MRFIDLQNRFTILSQDDLEGALVVGFVFEATAVIASGWIAELVVSLSVRVLNNWLA